MSARKKKIVLTEKDSPIWQAGFSRAISAVRRNRWYGVSPSVTDREEYGWQWGLFMRGWRAGIEAAWPAACYVPP